MKKLLIVSMLSFGLLAQADPSEEAENGQNTELTSTSSARLGEPVAVHTEAETITDQVTTDQSEESETVEAEQNNVEQDKNSQKSSPVVAVGKSVGNALFVTTKAVTKIGISYMFGVAIGAGASLAHKAVEEKSISVPCWPEYKADTYMNRYRNIEPGWRVVQGKKFKTPQNMTHEKVVGSAAVLSLLPVLPFGAAGFSAIAGMAMGYALFWTEVMEHEYKQ